MQQKFIQGVRDGTHYFTSAVNCLITVLLLSIVYIIGVGLTAVVLKIFGKSAPILSVESNKTHNDTYWINLPTTKERGGEQYYRQF